MATKKKTHTKGKGPIIEATNLTKVFEEGDVRTAALNDVSLSIKHGEFVAIMGRSGAGKSTLMYQLSLLDTPTSGSIMLDGHSVGHTSQEEATHIRLTKLGYVFQDYSLIPELTALENVMIPLLMQGSSYDDARTRASLSLSHVGLSERLSHLPSKLSGGEQQRVSIARAINHDPKILFADEPTANLDSQSSETVISIFEQLHKEQGLTIVMVTHEEEFGKRAERIIRLSDGKIVEKR